MKATVIVLPKKTVLDPQGEAVRKAIVGLGMDCIASARIGKFIELEITGQNVELTRTKLDQICKDLLSNPVIEDYQLVIQGSAAKAPAVAKTVKRKTPSKKVAAKPIAKASAPKAETKAEKKARKKLEKAAKKAAKKKKKS
jgi:phosphoribosylformylglycinamidine synthase subunit PurS